LAKVSGGKCPLPSRKLSFLKPAAGSFSMFTSARLCRLTGSSSDSVLQQEQTRRGEPRQAEQH
jgi:hypothetical protein